MILNSLNPTKACGLDNITIRMLLLCGDSIVPPNPIFCHNILRTGVYPDTCEEANVSSVHKKGNKQIVNNHRLISLLPILLRVLKRFCSNICIII